MCLTAAGGKIPKDLSWAAGKKYMGNVDSFLKSLLSFDKDNIPVNCVDTVERDYISNPGFRPENIKSKSSAAAGLCGWVLNICKYFRIYQVGRRRFLVCLWILFGCWFQILPEASGLPCPSPISQMT
jgi:dynein heavy chain